MPIVNITHKPFSNLTRITRTGDLRTVRVTTNTSNLENRIYHTTDTLSGDKSSSNGIRKDVELVLVALLPDVADDGADERGGGVDSGHDGEAHGHDHDVRPVGTYPLALADEDKVTDQDHGAAPNGENDGEDA